MRVPGQKFFVPANIMTIAGMTRSYKPNRFKARAAIHNINTPHHDRRHLSG